MGIIAQLIRKIKGEKSHADLYKDNIANGYYSQYGQDCFIANKLANKKGGVFLDIGANDGVSLSNSYYFEKHLNWTGIAIEPIPIIFKKLAANRNCIKIEGCIDLLDGETKFLAIDGAANMLSGKVETLHSEHKKRIEKETKQNKDVVNEITVATYNLMNLCNKNNISKIDYLSIDIEGGEFEILNSIDFKNLPIQFITVENNYNDNRINNLLINHKYIHIATLGCDDVYEKSI
jgi:FkbM family methyltransferase